MASNLYLNRVSAILFAVLLCLNGKAQTSLSSENVWKGYVNALEKDIKHNEQLARERAAQQKREDIAREIATLKECLSVEYSYENVQKTTLRLDKFSKEEKALTVEDKQIIHQLRENICAYDKEVDRFIKMCSVDTITDAKYLTLMKRKDNWLPAHLRTITRIFVEKYEQQGLATLTFPECYVYLNEKLQQFRQLITEIMAMNSDTQLMYEKLQQLLKIESEISASHNTYYPMF